MVCDDHLAPTNGRQFSSGLETVSNIKEVDERETFNLFCSLAQRGKDQGSFPILFLILMFLMKLPIIFLLLLLTSQTFLN